MNTVMTEDIEQLTDHIPNCLTQFPCRNEQDKDNFSNKKTSKCKNTYSKRTLQLFFIILLYFLTQNGVLGFNLDVNFPTIVTIPEKKSYFGYSVDMYVSEEETWLLVGAPKARSRGEVYKCKYEENIKNNCTRLHIVKDDSATSSVKDMFGMTMLTGEGKQLLACAPFFTQLTKVNRGQSIEYYDLLGICYFTDDFTMATPNVFKLIPCQGDKGSYHDGDAHGNCQAGFSAAFTKNWDNILLGAPGSFYRQGSIMLERLPIRNDVTVLPIHTGEADPIIPEGWKKNDWVTQSYDDNYLGYAVATGKSVEESQLLFVSAPRRFGYDLLGMVIVYDDRMDAALYNFTGTQTGEYFGSGLAAVDLNNDGLDDVVIGAPLYSDFDKQLAENGRVYVYLQSDATTLLEDGFLSLQFHDPIIIEGTSERARFGNTISAIGDVNRDGYNDIAIGAPYAVNDAESDKSDGSVFIFNGAADGLEITASQEIKGMKLNDKLKAFGISVSGGKDVDSNGYPDIFIGAYMSDQAVLIRSRPVIDINSNVNVNPETVELESKYCPKGQSTTSCFKITTCFSYQGISIPPSIQLGYTYDIDSMKTGDEKRAFILDETPRNITLRQETKNKAEVLCVDEYAYLKIDLRDKLTEIDVKVSHFLIERDQPVEPVLNELRLNYSSFQVKLFKDCGEDDICQADLDVETNLDKDVVYVGQEWPIVLHETVTNKGEPAFLSMLYVEFPKDVYYVGVQDKVKASGVGPLCTNIDQYVTCELGNPMKRETNINVNLKFQTSGLNGNVSELKFKSFVNSTNPTNNTSNFVSSPLMVAAKSDVVVYNTSSPLNIFLKDEDREKKSKLAGNMTKVIHSYEIINNGPSDISAGTITIKWPLLTNDGKSLLELVEMVVDKSRVSCDPVKLGLEYENININAISTGPNLYNCDDRAYCASVTCSIGHLRRKEEVTMQVYFALPFSTILRNDFDSYLRSEFMFQIDEYPYAISTGPGPTIKSDITTNCLYVRDPATKEVEWWIIAIAIVAGVIFLLLLIFGLWRCGFFVRKRKPEGGDQGQKEKLNPNGVDDDAEEMENYLK